MVHDDDDEFQLLSNDDWKILDSLETIFQMFDDVTLEIRGEKYVTISKVLVFIKVIHNKISRFMADVELCSNENVKNLLDNLSAKFLDTFKNYENSSVLAMSTILDQRYKKLGFQDASKYAEGLRKVKNKLSQDFQEQREIIPETPSTFSSETSAGADNYSSLWSDFDEEAQLLTGAQDPKTASIIEADKYDKEPFLPREDPLKYWVDRKNI